MVFVLELECEKGKMKCADGIHCFPRYTLCNYRAYCKDGSDDDPEMCKSKYTFCRVLLLDNAG